MNDAFELEKLKVKAEEDEKATVVGMSFLCLTIFLIGIAVGLAIGASVEQKKMEAKAIAAGVAHYVVDSNGVVSLLYHSK